MNTLLIDRFESPIGEVLLVSDGESLRALDFDDCEERMTEQLARSDGNPRLEERDDPQGFSSALKAYFGGALDALDALPAEPAGTAFQRAVWAALREIPCGATTSYGALAAQLGRPSASRAVGAANGLNPVAVVVPCHRVIGADGSLTGYAGGLARKRWLLAHEGALLDV